MGGCDGDGDGRGRFPAYRKCNAREPEASESPSGEEPCATCPDRNRSLPNETSRQPGDRPLTYGNLLRATPSSTSVTPWRWVPLLGPPRAATVIGQNFTRPEGFQELSSVVRCTLPLPPPHRCSTPLNRSNVSSFHWPVHGLLLVGPSL